MTTPYLVAQTLKGPKLQLLDGAFATVQFFGNFPHALLVEEAAQDHQSLIVWKTIHELIEDRPLLCLGLHATIGSVPVHALDGIAAIPGCALPPVGQRVGSDPQQPARKGRASPLKTAQAAQSLMEDLSGYVLGLSAVMHPPNDEGVDSVKILFVKLRKPARILLSCFD